MRRNRVELSGAVATPVERRSTPAGTPVAFFRIRVEADPEDPAVTACEVPVVCLGPDAAPSGVEPGRRVLVDGALTERRWKGPGGTWQSRFEVLARTVRVL